jgi:hypothetical protein
MIRNQQVHERWMKQRLEGKSIETMFQNRLIEEARCSPILARAIWGIVNETLCGPVEVGEQAARVGQVTFLAVSAEEPAGKPLTQCQKVTVRLTLDAGADDQEVRWRHGLDGVRRARILRMCVEAREQGGLLSYEDLAIRLLNCGVRTVVRDVAALRKSEIVVPSRGQQQDIGPGQTHRVQAVRLYLAGHEPQQIADRLYHSLKAIESYLKTFGRVVFLTDRGCDVDEIAFVVQRSSVLVAEHQRLAQAATSGAAQRRLAEIIRRANPAESVKHPVSPAKQGVTR